MGHRRVGGPGRPFHVPKEFDSTNLTTLSDAQLRKELEDGRLFMRELKRICQCSVGRLQQIVDRLAYRCDREGFHTKVAAFDRVKAAIELLKPPPTVFQLFAAERRTEILNQDVALSESEIQKQLSREWKA